MLVLNTIFLDLTRSYQVSMEEVTGQQQVAQREQRGCTVGMAISLERSPFPAKSCEQSCELPPRSCELPLQNL